MRMNNKVIIGLCCCRVYIQSSAVRCYNCQEIGHIAKSCQNSTVCGKCSLPHDTKVCSSGVIKCHNCHKKGNPHDHYAFDFRCPLLSNKNAALKHLNIQ